MDSKLPQKLDRLFTEFVDSVNCELNEGTAPDTVIASVSRFVTLSLKVAEDIIMERGRFGREAFIDAQLNAISDAKVLKWRRRAEKARAA